MNSSDTDGETGAYLPEEHYDAKAATSASDYEEKTEVIYGEENVVRRALQVLPTLTKTLDLCRDRNGPSILLLNEQIKQMYIDLDNRGVRQRNITEITKENIIHCKELMKFQELRHLDGLKGFLGIVDGRVLTSHAYGQESKTLSHMVVSTVRVFVEQQQYFFETLWSKAIPAEQRIREILEGIKPEVIETIREPEVTQARALEMIQQTRKSLSFSRHLMLSDDKKK